jgi:hypothetical protein
MLAELGAVPVIADALDPDQVAEAVGRALASGTSVSGCLSRSSRTATMIRPGTRRWPTRYRWRCW